MEERLASLHFFPSILLSLFIILPSSSSSRSPSFSFFLSFFFFPRFVSFLSEFLEIYRHDDIPSWTRANNWDGFHIGLFNRLQRRALARLMGNFSRLDESVQTRDRNFLVEASLLAWYYAFFLFFWSAIGGCNFVCNLEVFV